MTVQVGGHGPSERDPEVIGAGAGVAAREWWHGEAGSGNVARESWRDCMKGVNRQEIKGISVATPHAGH